MGFPQIDRHQSIDGPYRGISVTVLMVSPVHPVEGPTRTKPITPLSGP